MAPLFRLVVPLLALGVTVGAGPLQTVPQPPVRGSSSASTSANHVKKGMIVGTVIGGVAGLSYGLVLDGLSKSEGDGASITLPAAATAVGALAGALVGGLVGMARRSQRAEPVDATHVGLAVAPLRRGGVVAAVSFRF